MAKELKVYGWNGYRPASQGPGNSHGQTHEVMAAYSVAEVLRAANLSRHDWKHSGGETGNQREIDVAMANPGRVIWRGYNDWDGDEFRAADGQPLNVPKVGMTARRLIAILQKLTPVEKDLPLMTGVGADYDWELTDNLKVVERSGKDGRYITFEGDW